MSDTRVTQLEGQAIANASASDARVTKLDTTVLTNEEPSATRITQLYVNTQTVDEPSAARITHLYVNVLVQQCVPIFSRIITSPLNDTTLRPQYMGHKVMLEVTTDPLNVSDDVATWTIQEIGYCTRATLRDALTWEIVIGDTDRVERQTKLFNGPDLLIGQPSAFFGVPNQGNPFTGVTVDTMATFEVLTVESGEFITIRFVPTAVPFFFNFDAFNALAEQFSARVEDYAAFNRPYIYPNIIVELHDLTTGELITTGSGTIRGVTGQFTPISGGFLHPLSPIFSYGELFGLGLTVTIDWAADQPDVGDRFAVYMYVTVATDMTPFHFQAHPVDIATAIYDGLGIVYDAASAAATKAALGPDLSLILRPTEPIEALTILEDWLQGPIGFAYRVVEGVRHFYPTRLRDNVTPSLGIDLSSLRGEGAPYDLSQDATVTRIVWEEQTFLFWQRTPETPIDSRPLDGIVATAATTIQNQEDSNAAPYQGEVTYSYPGILIDPLFLYATPENSYKRQIASEIFFRWGRGAAVIRWPMLPGFAGLVGEYVVNTVNYSPIPEPNQDIITIRPKDYPDRHPRQVLQIVKRTDSPAGPDLTLLVVGPVPEDVDDGSGFLLVPELTIAPNANLPKNSADITVTNWSTIRMDVDNRVELQYGLGNVEPTNWTSFGSLYPAGTAGISGTPLLPAGSHVWVRARTWNVDGRFSDWSDTVDVDLADLSPPTNFVGTQVDDSLTFIFTWDVGEPTELVVFRFKEPLDLAWTEVVSLPAGSNRFEYAFEAVNVSYEVEIFHRQLLPVVTESDHVQITVTTGTTLPQLNRPLSPIATTGNGHVQFCVTVGDINADQTVFQYAAEQPDGSFGAWTTFFVIAHSGTSVCASADFPQEFSIYDPTRGRHYQLQAYHTAIGYTDSASSDVLTIDPWQVMLSPALELLYNYNGDPLANYAGQSLNGVIV